MESSKLAPEYTQCVPAGNKVVRSPAMCPRISPACKCGMFATIVLQVQVLLLFMTEDLVNFRQLNNTEPMEMGADSMMWELGQCSG